MESAKNNTSSKTSLLLEEEDTTLSKFRKKNKLLILVFSVFFTSLALIMGALIIYLIQFESDSDQSSMDNQYSLIPLNTPAVQAYYSGACYTPSCLAALDPIISTKSITDPTQIFTLSLQTASENLQNLTSLFKTDQFSEFKKCSNIFYHALSLINDTLELTGLEKQSDDEQRSEMISWINVVDENLESCVDDLENSKVESSDVSVRVREVKVYVSSSREFLMNYAFVMKAFSGENKRVLSFGDVLEQLWSNISEFGFGACLFVLQLFFLIFLFWSVLRSR